MENVCDAWEVFNISELGRFQLCPLSLISWYTLSLEGILVSSSPYIYIHTPRTHTISALFSLMYTHVQVTSPLNSLSLHAQELPHVLCLVSLRRGVFLRCSPSMEMPLIEVRVLFSISISMNNEP